jgi:hypothetical protein
MAPILRCNEWPVIAIMVTLVGGVGQEAPQGKVVRRMRRTLLLVCAMASALLLASGVGTLDEPSKDSVSGGSGKDVFLVDNKPAMKDILTCGPGFDRALADRKDLVAADCEKVVVVHGTLQDVIRQENRFFQSIPQGFFQGLPG